MTLARATLMWNCCIVLFLLFLAEMAGFRKRFFQMNTTERLVKKDGGIASNVQHCYTDHCPKGRINKLYIRPTRGASAAGLSDRKIVFETMTNLAGWLCATLYAPPPYQLLNPYHNQGFPAMNVSMGLR
ncbi:hypothetical protein MPSEU_000395200 [Mayamaea pseudoterrestris]|nr:hypothetical protein MPSEU_000395200 [Mayamaea pseudoterrestris]